MIIRRREGNKILLIVQRKNEIGDGYYNVRMFFDTDKQVDNYLNVIETWKNNRLKRK